ncbi:putative serine/threonine-protein kinase [Heracleum sosnowskyi]|uniref:Serine/threonine-protein kinase n=1 Tax=Heracleum sosnowskyi TaxID=360622 RepID=A0AAD8MTY0_9APIA|nr:putative serine/threonine-protein kinase [Heracleum sosnowskyi]
MYGVGNTRERLASYSDGNSRERSSSMASSELRVGRRSMLNRGEGSRRRDQIDSKDGRQLLLDNHSSSSIPMRGDNCKNERGKMEFVFRVQHPGSGGIPRARQGEQVAAGWPSWLTEVAGEALKGWIPRRLDSFENLVKIGQGTYSNVFRARDMEKGKVVALKKVKFNKFDRRSISFMAREIRILRWLHHPNIIKLEGVVTSRMSDTLYLVFEYMEHDLTGLASRPGLKFTEPQIKCYMKQLLCGIDYCHRRGILHRDIKGSNLLIDNDGILKIADFGLANFYYQHQVEPMTNRVVTLWYRPPELLLGATCYRTAIDLWSIGCVLAELYAGRPIMTGRTEVQQLYKIFKLCGSPSEEYWRMSELPLAARFKPKQPYRRCIAERFKDLPAPALSLIETLLSIDPAARLSAAHALNSEFFSSNPLACESAELPKYPPSKELDAIRQAKGRSKVERYDVQGEGTSKSRAMAAPDANAESVFSIEKKMGQCNFRNEKFNPRQEESASGFSIKPPRPRAGDEVICRRERTLHQNTSHYTSHSGPLVQRAARDEVGKNMNYAPKIPSNSVSSRMSSFAIPKRSLAVKEWRVKYESSQLEVTRGIRKPGSYNEAYDFTRKQDDDGHKQSIVSHANEDARSSNRDPLPLGYNSKGRNVRYSGRLQPPAGNVNQMLRDHDHCHVQETASWHAHVDKGKQKRLQSEAIPLPTNAIGPMNRPN